MKILRTLLLLSLASPLAAECISWYTAPRAYDAGNLAFQTADFDGDGHLDVLARGRDLGILYGRGDGTLEAIVKFRTETVGNTHVADFNLDGRPDVVFSHYVDDLPRTIVLMNLGLRRFTQQTVALGLEPMAAADFTGDGRPDLVLGSHPRSELVLLRQSGGRALAFRTLWMQKLRAARAAVGDFNGDGAMDLAISTPVVNEIGMHLLFNDGSGMLTKQPRLDDRGVNPFVVDIDGDASDDIIAIASARDIDVYRGGSTQRISNPSPYGPRTVAAGDFDGDRITDVAVLHDPYDAHSVVIYRGDGHGGLIRHFELPFPGRGTGLATGDFNEDGLLDLVMPWNDSERLIIAKGNGDGTFAQVLPHVRTFYADRLVGTADVNGDGVDELLARTDGFAYVQWLQPDGSYSFLALRGRLLAWGDVDGAPGDELLIAGTHTLYLYRATRTGFEQLRTIASGDYFTAAALAELSPRAGPEIAVTTYYGSLLVLASDGTRLSITATVVSYDHEIHPADFDRDGFDELLVIHDDSVQLLRGNGNGGFDHHALFGWGDVRETAIGDFDGDSFLDILLALRDETLLFRGEGRGFAAPQRVSLPRKAWPTLRAFDFNFDGITDILTDSAIWYGTRDDFRRETYAFLTGTAILARRRAGADPSIVIRTTPNSLMVIERKCQ